MHVVLALRRAEEDQGFKVMLSYTISSHKPELYDIMSQREGLGEEERAWACQEGLASGLAILTHHP